MCLAAPDAERTTPTVVVPAAGSHPQKMLRVCTLMCDEPTNDGDRGDGICPCGQHSLLIGVATIFYDVISGDWSTADGQLLTPTGVFEVAVRMARQAAQNQQHAGVGRYDAVVLVGLEPDEAAPVWFEAHISTEDADVYQQELCRLVECALYLLC